MMGYILDSTGHYLVDSNGIPITDGTPFPTVLDMIQDAFEKLGTYAVGDAISSADLKRAFSVLNDMIDSWSNESLSTFAILEESGPLNVGQQTYTIGPGGYFNVPRPLYIMNAPGSAYIQDSQGNIYPLDVVPKTTWNLIGQRFVNSNLPDTLYYDNQFPLGIINIFPVPNINYTIFFDSYAAISAFNNPQQQITLPPGYKKAIQDNLAVELYPYYPTADIPIETIIAIASKSKGNIKRSNLRQMVARFDSELVSRVNVTPNIYTGGTN